MKHTLSILAVALTVCLHGFAKQPQQPQSYNYQRGTELLQQDQLEEGLSFLDKEIRQHPKNGYAYAWIASAYANKEERGTALHYIDLAIKYLPRTDKYYIAWSYSLRGRIYLQLQDTAQALACLKQAIKTEPNNEDWYESRGRLYSDLRQWEKADADFRQYIKLAPGNIRGYLSLGRILYLQEKYAAALEQYQYAHKLAERAYTFSAMAEAEVKLAQYEQAADHIIEALKRESYESTCLDLLADCKDEDFQDLITTKLHVQTLAHPNVEDWYVYIMYLHRNRKEYEKAILVGNKVLSISPEPFYEMTISALYRAMGDWDNALRYVNRAIAADSTDTDYRLQRTFIYNQMDSVPQMFADFNELIEQHPDNAEFYFARGRANFFHKNYQQAIEDFNIGLAIDSSDDWDRYMRGRCLEAAGQTDKGRKDFLQVENSRQKPEVRMFAKASLGKRDEALSLADSLLLADTIDYEHRYNVACVYALVGETERAFQALEEELKDGYVGFTYLRQDPDLQSLQGDRLEQLIRQYQQIAQERIARFHNPDEDNQSDERVVEIPFSAANGVTKVDCTINGLPLNFVFDTGASDVSLSQVEANFMYKNGYLTDKDVIGKQHYQTADGNISVGTVINLRQINFGGLELKDVRASVTKSRKAPLLLGQSVLQRLGKIEIDNDRRVLKITTK